LSSFLDTIKTMLKKLLKKLTPKPLLSLYHYCLAFLGTFFYGFPSRKLTVIGITGTSGKSTVAELISAILEQAGNKVALISSIKFKVGEREEPNKLKMTMPGRFKIQKFLREALKANCKYVILEVTSEGIKQHRHKFINFKIATFTNLSKEHIESHGSFEKYREAKLKLFQETKDTHIINLDDRNADSFWKVPAKNKINYTLKDSHLIPKSFSLLGTFNIYNAIAATKIALALNIPLAVCQKALENFKQIEGRMEIVNQDPLVIVDYAHTPESLKQVYKTLKDKSLVCVLGSCGGGRDKWKRPVMGKIASQYCQKIIITNEDPYDEDPMEIINQVARDIQAEKILDRREAIKKALTLDGTVIITGKGSEPWMCLANGKKIPWDDRKTVRELLQ